MTYDPKEKRGRPNIHEGLYDFIIVESSDRVFSTKTEGTTLVMDVFLPEDRVIKCYENIYYTKAALWKVEQLCDCVGLDFDTRPKGKEFLRQSGKGLFTRRKKSKFLEVETFLSKKDLAKRAQQHRSPPPQVRRVSEPPDRQPPPPPPKRDDYSF